MRREGMFADIGHIQDENILVGCEHEELLAVCRKVFVSKIVSEELLFDFLAGEQVVDSQAAHSFIEREKIGLSAGGGLKAFGLGDDFSVAKREDSNAKIVFDEEDKIADRKGGSETDGAVAELHENTAARFAGCGVKNFKNAVLLRALCTFVSFMDYGVIFKVMIRNIGCCFLAQY